MTLMKHAGSWVLAGLLGLSMSVAQAATSAPVLVAPFTQDAHSVLTPAGGPGVQAMPSLSFTFDSAFDLAGFTLNLDYDASLMSFNAGASTVSSGGGVASLVDVLGALQGASTPGDFVVFPPTNTPGAYSLSAFYLAGSFPIAPQTVTFNAVFDLLPAFTAGTTGMVTFSGSLDNAAFETYPIDAVASVTAVPEPETWLMLLGGLGLLASRVRRRNR